MLFESSFFFAVEYCSQSVFKALANVLILDRRKSTRSDVVAVKISGGDSGCSDRAVIYATSKHESEQTAMVFAEEKGTHYFFQYLQH